MTPTLARPLPALAPLARVLRSCQMHRFQALGPDHASLPVPVLAADGLRVVRMLSPTRIDADTGARHVAPPSYLVEQRADTGAFAEARAVSSRHFALDHAPDADLGPLVRPDDFEDRLHQLGKLLDAVLPVFALGPARPGSAAGLTASRGDPAAVSLPETTDSAREARAAYWALAEAPLVPYYRALGKAFFAFLDRAAGAS